MILGDESQPHVLVHFWGAGKGVKALVAAL